MSNQIMNPTSPRLRQLLEDFRGNVTIRWFDGKQNREIHCHPSEEGPSGVEVVPQLMTKLFIQVEKLIYPSAYLPYTERISRRTLAEIDLDDVCEIVFQEKLSRRVREMQLADYLPERARWLRGPNGILTRHVCQD